MKDIIYFYDKSTFERFELGEIQSDFNMSFVIDGTKDSAKVDVYNFEEKEVEPFTIVKHKSTNTWWIITNDKVERYANESGCMYVHSLTLLGAINLLNYRDLTNCGFTERRYTLKQMALRIMKLSNFELPVNFISNSLINENQIVEYLKSFENYSPLSALNEIFDGYNCSIKMSFNELSSGTPTKYYLSSANLYLISKVGNNSTYIEDDVFNNVQETKTMNSNSFGSTALSNAQNVISSISKTYPLAGTVALSSNAHDIDNTNAILRLPSPIFSVNWVKMFPSLTLRLRYEYEAEGIGTQYADYSISDVVISNGADLEQAITKLAQSLAILHSTAANALLDSYKEYEETLINGCSITFNKIKGYDINNDNIISNKKLPLVYSFFRQAFQEVLNFRHEVGIATKQLRDSFSRPEYAFYYEQGRDYIGGFEILDNYNGELTPLRRTYATINSMDSQYYTDNNGYVYCVSYQTTYNNVTYKFKLGANVGKFIPIPYQDEIVLNAYLSTTSARFKVNYIPMSEVKIKYNNNGKGNDTQIYNQTGKLNDGVALSKLILSYVDQIETDNITKFGSYYDYANIPQCGQVVKIGTLFYVINNVSLTFHENEDDTYFIKAEFTLSKNIAVKSMLTNPNSDIRDYNIPQNENIKRIQLYRDFYELGHGSDENATVDWYMPLTKLLNVSNVKDNKDEHTCVMKLTYDREVNNNNTYYYQLDTIKYVFKKSMYEILNFKDNNIIGYDNQSVYTGFDVTKLFTHIRDMINTPISYTDDYGEVKDIYVAFCTSEQLIEQYNNLALDNGSTLEISQISVHAFIPSEIYEGNANHVVGAKDDNDFLISEIDYKKDAIEVPVFEYSCQLDNSNDVIIGDNIFDNSDNSYYIYEIFRVAKNSINENNYTILNSSSIDFSNAGVISFAHSCAKIEYNSSTKMSITQYDSLDIIEDGNEIVYGTKENISGTQDYVIIRRNVSPIESYTKSSSEVVFGSLSDGTLTYEINAQEGETISNISCELTDGYKDDQPYSNCSYSDDRVQYVIGGVNYDDTLAYALLTIIIDVPSYSGTASVSASGRDLDGSQDINIPNLDPNTDTISNITISIVSPDEDDYANILDVDQSTLTIQYECGNYAQPNKRVNVVISCDYTRSGTIRTETVNISGTRTQTKYYLVELGAGETIDSATISNIELQNNNFEGAFMNIISTSGNVVNYEIGCNIASRLVRGRIKWKVSGQSRNESKDLLFVIRNMENATIENGVLKLNINHYKLK